MEEVIEEVKSYFFDTYALYEIVLGNKAYEAYTKNVLVITSLLNLMELHYILLRTQGKEEAERAFQRFREYCIQFNDALIKEANEFRLQNYRRDLSYVDCIGYMLAKRQGVKFLSGDPQFESFENVEFVP
jgi:predicted nucleic acid-binding protein